MRKGKGKIRGKTTSKWKWSRRGGGTGAKVVNRKGRRERSEGDIGKRVVDGRKGGWTKGHGEDDLRNGDEQKRLGKWG